MTKVYLLNQPKNNAVFALYGEGGNMVRYTFKDGNAGTNQPAKCILSNEYYQQLLENSEVFQKNLVKIDPTFKATKQTESTKALIKVADVKSVAQAVEWCAEQFGEVVKTAKQAKTLAEKNGYDLVNLKTKD